MNLHQLEHLADKLWDGEKVDSITLVALTESHIEATKRLELIDRVCEHFLDEEDKDFWALRGTIKQALHFKFQDPEGEAE